MVTERICIYKNSRLHNLLYRRRWSTNLFSRESVSLGRQHLCHTVKTSSDDQQTRCKYHESLKNQTITHNSFFSVPFPSGSKTLKALRIVSSGSAPIDEKWQFCIEEKQFHFFSTSYNGNSFTF